MTVSQTGKSTDLGLTRDQWHRYYWQGAEPLRKIGPMPGVTSILKVQEATGGDGLVKWAAGIAADYVLDTFPYQGLSQLTDREVIRNTAVAQTDKAASLGTAVHEQVRRVLHGEPIAPDPETVYHLAHFAAFMGREKPELFFAEEFIANLELGYGGQFDFIARLRDRVSVVDVKTGKLRPVHRLQLSLYMDAEFIGRPGSTETVPMPEIEAGYVLLLRPDGYDLVDMTPTKEDREHARYLASVYPKLKAWQKEQSE